MTRHLLTRKPMSAFLCAAMLTGTGVPSAVFPQDKSARPEQQAGQVLLDLVGQTAEPRASRPLGLAVVGKHAYLAGWHRGLRIVDISNVRDPRELRACRVQGHVGDLVVNGGYAFVAAGDGGLRVLDLAQPASPKEIGFCRTHGDTTAVAV